MPRLIAARRPTEERAQRLIAARRPTEERGQRDHGHFNLLAARYKYLRTFTPAVIAARPLVGNTASPIITALLNAVEVLRELNAAGRTTVPDEATTTEVTSFVSARWREYLDATRRQGHGAAYRHYWELSVLYGVHAAVAAMEAVLATQPPKAWPGLAMTAT